MIYHPCLECCRHNCQRVYSPASIHVENDGGGGVKGGILLIGIVVSLQTDPGSHSSLRGRGEGAFDPAMEGTLTQTTEPRMLEGSHL